MDAEEGLYASWMREDLYLDNKLDYWFLRKNGVNAKTTLKMLAMAYSPQQLTGGGGKRQ